MTPEQFCYWLQGFFELTRAKKLTTQQVADIQSHLETVFAAASTTALQRELEKIHTFEKVKPNKTKHAREEPTYCSRLGERKCSS